MFIQISTKVLPKIPTSPRLDELLWFQSNLTRGVKLRSTTNGSSSEPKREASNQTPSEAPSNLSALSNAMEELSVYKLECPSSAWSQQWRRGWPGCLWCCSAPREQLPVTRDWIRRLSCSATRWWTPATTTISRRCPRPTSRQTVLTSPPPAGNLPAGTPTGGPSWTSSVSAASTLGGKNGCLFFLFNDEIRMPRRTELVQFLFKER